MGLDEDVGRYFRLDKQAKEFDDRAKHARKVVDGLEFRNEEISKELIERMNSGERLEDPIQDYAFFHYGKEGPSKIPRINEFLSELDRYAGQMILEDITGYTTSSAGREPQHNLGRLKLGKLSESTPHKFSSSDRNLNAFTGVGRWTREGEDWKSCTISMNLNQYLDHFVARTSSRDNKKGEDSRIIKLGSFLQGIKFEDSGFEVSISSPVNPERTIGGSVRYDCEPHHTILVGDDLVRSYLDQKDFKIRTVEERNLGMPQGF